MKIICVGWNYEHHSKEHKGLTVRKHPVIFLKPETALLKDNKPVYIPDFTDRLEYELEVTVKINRLGKGIAEKFANRYYAEVGLGIDFTARDMQCEARSNGEPWDLSKGFDCSAPISGFVPLSSLGGDVQNLDFRLDIDGKCVQNGNTKDMTFSVDSIISYISRYYTLKIGDILFTGSPDSVGAVSIGNHLEGWLCGRKLLDFYIK